MAAIKPAPACHRSSRWLPSLKGIAITACIHRLVGCPATTTSTRKRRGRTEEAVASTSGTSKQPRTPTTTPTTTSAAEPASPRATMVSCVSHRNRHSIRIWTLSPRLVPGQPVVTDSMGAFARTRRRAGSAGIHTETGGERAAHSSGGSKALRANRDTLAASATTASHAFGATKRKCRKTRGVGGSVPLPHLANLPSHSHAASETARGTRSSGTGEACSGEGADHTRAFGPAPADRRLVRPDACCPAWILDACLPFGSSVTSN